MKELLTKSSPAVRPIWHSILIFLLLVVVLQWLWKQTSGTVVERFIIDQATASTGAYFINLFTPGIEAQAIGSRITANGGGINILNGCEGTEVLFLLIAALIAYPFAWRSRVIGLVAGAVLIYGVNQLRLLALFYSYRSDPALFDQLHGLIAPLLLIAITLVFFVLLMRWDEQQGLRKQGNSAP